MMDRRRALMMQKSDLTIDDLEMGVGVKFGSYIFIKCFRSTTYNVVHIMLEKLVDKRQFAVNGTTYIDYDGGQIDAYLINNYLPQFPQQLQSYLVDTPLTYTVSNAGATSTKVISRKVCIPKAGNLANNSSYVNALKTFYNTTWDDTARRATYDNTNTPYWTMDGTTNSGDVRTVWSNGKFTNVGCYGYYGVRPVFFLKPDTPIKLIDGVYTVV